MDEPRENVEGARLMREALGLANTRLERADITRVDRCRLCNFDISLLFGLLYHVNDPVGVLRRARALTKPSA